MRTLYDCRVERNGERLTIWIRGNGFLYNMVRIISGTLLEVGSGKREPEEMKRILEAHDRRAAGPTAPAKGLELVSYYFPILDELPESE